MFSNNIKIKAYLVRNLAKRGNVGGQLKTTTFIENIVSEKKQKKLSLRVTLTVEFAMFLVGVLTFFLWKIQNFTTMVTKMTSVVVGIALAGRKATIFHTIRH